MGRSVYTPSEAVETVYLADPAGITAHCFEDGEVIDGHVAQMLWSDFIAELCMTLQKRYPSLDTCGRRHGREGHAVLHNYHGEIVVADYCGCVSVSLVPAQEYNFSTENNLDAAWCYQIADNFREVVQGAFPDCAMVRQGVMSNGEAVYRKLEAPA